MHRVIPNLPEFFDRQEKSDQCSLLTKLPFNPQNLTNQFAGPVMRRCRDAGNALFHKQPVVLSHRFKHLIDADVSWR